MQSHVWIRAVLVFNKDSLGCTRLHLVMRHDLAIYVFVYIEESNQHREIL